MAVIGSVGLAELVVSVAVPAILVIGFALVIRWATSSRRARPCHRCGQPVRNGVLECPACGFNFRTIS